MLGRLAPRGVTWAGPATREGRGLRSWPAGAETARYADCYGTPA